MVGYLSRIRLMPRQERHSSGSLRHLRGCEGCHRLLPFQGGHVLNSRVLVWYIGLLFPGGYSHADWILVCALLANDEETCVTIARFFMKDYQFTTDSYRMFAAVTRLCHSPVSWYSSGPTQKYILRQIKAMDFALVDEGRREKYFSEKGSYSAQDENGRLVINNDMDIALLMLYGHILFTGSSYAYALSKIFILKSRRRLTLRRLLLPGSYIRSWESDDQS